MTKANPSTDRDKREPSRLALWKCAKWLEHCIEIGWSKSYLDALEALWWKHHDDRGELRNGY